MLIFAYLDGSGNPGLEQSQQRLEDTKTVWGKRASALKQAIQQLVRPRKALILEEEEQ